MLGPNSAGVFSATGGVNVLGWKVPSGSISLVTQSGNVAGTFTQHARMKGVGFASILAVGNSADLTLSELVDLLLHDDATKGILIYCEGFLTGDGRRLVEIVRSSPIRKPIVMLKPGVSEAGRSAAHAHTGSLAGEDDVVSAALASAGIIRASEAEEAFDLVIALSSSPAPRGPRIAVLSDGGGHATIVSDCLGKCGLDLATFAPETKARLRAVMPDRSAVENPVDFAGLAESNPDSTAKVLKICIDDANVDGLIFAGHLGAYHLMTEDAATQEAISRAEMQAAQEIAQAAAVTDKPILMHCDYAERGLFTHDPFRAARVPLYSALESPAKAMAALFRWGALASGSRARARDAGPAEIGLADRIRERVGRRVLLDPEARDRLVANGVPVPPHVIAAAVEDAVAAFRSLDSPVALKLISERAVHKSEVGGVALDCRTAEDVSRQFLRLSDAARRIGERQVRIMVTPMIAAGVECIIGAKFDPQFGPVVVFGAGGILVELVKDTVLALAPIDVDAALSLIGASKVGRVMAGYRGGPAVDVRSTAALLSSISRVFAAADDAVELDLNPVIVNADGAHIADARMTTTG
jgi:acetyltransferase